MSPFNPNPGKRRTINDDIAGWVRENLVVQVHQESESILH